MNFGQITYEVQNKLPNELKINVHTYFWWYKPQAIPPIPKSWKAEQIRQTSSKLPLSLQQEKVCNLSSALILTFM